MEEWGWGGLPPRAAWGPDEIRHIRHLPAVPGTLSSPWLPQLAGDFFLRPPVHPVTHGCPSPPWLHLTVWAWKCHAQPEEQCQDLVSSMTAVLTGCECDTVLPTGCGDMCGGGGPFPVLSCRGCEQSQNRKERPDAFPQQECHLLGREGPHGSEQRCFLGSVKPLDWPGKVQVASQSRSCPSLGIRGYGLTQLRNDEVKGSGCEALTGCPTSYEARPPG